MIGGGRKSKVRSMRRGAQKRTRSDPINLPPPTLTSRDRVHFAFENSNQERILDELDGHVRALQRNGFTKPRKVAEFLNKQNLTTAVGERWTPRLTHFLLAILFERRKEKKAGPIRRQGNRPPDEMTAFGATSHAKYRDKKLSDVEIEQRIQAVRRFYGPAD